MNINGQVGPIASTSSIAAGQQPVVRLGQMGEIIKSDLHGRYYEGTYRRSRMNAASQAGGTTTVGFATTYVGIMLSNPVGATVNMVLEKVGMAFLVAFTAAAALGICCGYNSSTNVTHTAAATVRSNFFGVGAAGQGLVDTSATLPTAPVATHILGAGLTGAITVQTSEFSFFDLEGSIVLPPGAYAGTFTSTAGGASAFWGSLQYEEVPV